MSPRVNEVASQVSRVLGDTNLALFFVYGTLQPGEYNHDSFFKGNTIEEFKATVTDEHELYAGPGFPYLVQAPTKTTKIHGYALRVDPEKLPSVLKQLDNLEGVPNHYTRAKVKLDDGQEAWAYYATDKTFKYIQQRQFPRCIGGKWTRQLFGTA